MNIEAYNQFRDTVAASKLDAKLGDKPVVAVLHGPCAVIECVVREASKQSNIPMDWGYSGGRAFVHADGDEQKARDALVFAMAGGLSLADLGRRHG